LGVELVHAIWVAAGAIMMLISGILRLIGLIPGLEEWGEAGKKLSDVWVKGHRAISRAAIETLGITEDLTGALEEKERVLESLTEDVERFEVGLDGLARVGARWNAEIREYLPNLNAAVLSGKDFIDQLIDQITYMREQIAALRTTEPLLAGMTLEQWESSEAWATMTETQRGYIRAFFKLQDILRRERQLKRMREELRDTNKSLREQIRELELQRLRVMEGEKAYLDAVVAQIKMGKGSENLKQRLADLTYEVESGRLKLIEETKALEAELEAAKKGAQAHEIFNIQRRLGVGVTEEEARRIFELKRQIEALTTGIDAQIRAMQSRVDAMEQGEEAERRWQIAQRFGLELDDERIDRYLELEERIESQGKTIGDMIAKLEREVAILRQGADAWEAYKIQQEFAGKETTADIERLKRLRDEHEKLREAVERSGREVPRTFGEGVRTALRDFRSASVAMGEIGKRTAEGLTDAFSTFFFEALRGNIEGALEAFRRFFDMILSMIMRFLAERIVRAFLEVLFPERRVEARRGAVAVREAAELIVAGKGGILPGEFKAFQEGAIVRRPTLGLVGERGPEAVIPLERGAVPVELRAQPITINISAIDTVSGLDFLFRHKGQIQRLIGESLGRNLSVNRFIRRYV